MSVSRLGRGILTDASSWTSEQMWAPGRTGVGCGGTAYGIQNGGGSLLAAMRFASAGFVRITSLRAAPARQCPTTPSLTSSPRPRSIVPPVPRFPRNCDRPTLTFLASRAAVKPLGARGERLPRMVRRRTETTPLRRPVPARRRRRRRLEPRADVQQRRLVVGDVARQRVGERGPDAVDRLGVDVEGLRESREVRHGEVDAGTPRPGAILVEAQHPVAAVVDDDRGER